MTRQRSTPPGVTAGPRLRLVNAQRLPVHLLAVQAGNRSERVLLAWHLDEPESLRGAREEVALHFCRPHFTERLEQLGQFRLSGLRSEIPYEDFHVWLTVQSARWSGPRNSAGT